MSNLYLIRDNLGAEFDLGVLESSKVHVKTGTGIRHVASSWELEVDPTTLGNVITNALSLAGTTITSTVQGVDATLNLAPAIQAGETTTVLGYNATTKILSYTNEDGATNNLDLSALAVDVFIDQASLDPVSLVLTLTDNAGNTVTTDLTDLKIVETLDSENIAFTGNGTDGSKLTAEVILDPVVGNALISGADGLSIDVLTLFPVLVEDAFSIPLYRAGAL